MAVGSLVYEDARVRLAQWKNVGVSTWFDAPLMEQLVELRAFAEHLRATFPGGYGFASIARTGRPNFSADVRQETAAITRDTAPWTFATAHVVLLDGLAGLAVRSFLQTMLLLSRAPHNVQVFGDLAQAATFMTTYMGEEAPALDDLLEVLEELATPSAGSG